MATDTRARRRWSDLTPATRATVIGLGAAQVGLAAAGYVDLSRRRPKDLHGSKGFWRGAMLVNFVGPIAYFGYGRRR